MTVFRVEKNANYSVMANYHFRDKTLSWKAKGILSNMLSLPDDWDYSLAGLKTLASDGESATRSAIKELEEHGYLIRRPIRKNGKISDWEYIIFEYPQAENQNAEMPLVENQQVENQAQLNNNKSTTKQLNNKESSIKGKEERKRVAASFNSLIDNFVNTHIIDLEEREKVKSLLGDWLKVRKAKRAAMTDRSIELNLNKLYRLAEESNMSVADYLEEVICKGWTAFYPIKDYSKPAPKQSGTNNPFLDLLKDETGGEW